MKPYTAAMDGYALNLLDIGDVVEAAIHKHEFIGTNGALMEDMGNRPRQIKFKSYWMGSTAAVASVYKSPTYQNHYDFLNKATDAAVRDHLFTHPKYGLIHVLIDTIAVRHDDTQDYAEIDITCTQTGINKAFVSQQTLNHISQQVAHLNAQLGKMTNEISAANFSSVLNKAVSATSSIVAQMSNVTGKARDFLKECDSFVSKLNQISNNVTAPLNTVNNLVSYTGDLPSALIGTAQSAVDRVMTSNSNLINLPATFTNNTTTSLRGLADSLTGQHASFFKTHLLAISSAGVMATLSGMYQDDEKTRSAKATLESSPAFDNQGNRIGKPSAANIYSLQDIESSLFLARDFVQQALDLDRDNDTLKDLCVGVIAFIDIIKLKKRTTINMTVTNTPLHVLCSSMGLSYEAADRVLAINPQIKNPTFVSGKVTMYAS